MADLSCRVGRNRYDADGHVIKVLGWLANATRADAVGSITTTSPHGWGLRALREPF